MTWLDHRYPKIVTGGGARELQLGQLWPPLPHGQRDCPGAQLGKRPQEPPQRPEPVPRARWEGRYRARAPRPRVPHPQRPSPVQIVTRRARRAPGGGEGVLGQLGEAEPRGGLPRPRALLPLAGGRLGDGLRGGHG